MTKTKNLDLCTLDIEIFFCPFHMQLCRPFSPCTGNKHAFCLKLALNAMKAESVIIQFSSMKTMTKCNEVKSRFVCAHRIVGGLHSIIICSFLPIHSCNMQVGTACTCTRTCQHVHMHVAVCRTMRVKGGAASKTPKKPFAKSGVGLHR